MSTSNEIRRGIWTALALIAAAIVLKRMLAGGIISGDTSQRLIQMAIGAVLVLTGNLVPKRLRKMSEDNCEPSRRQSLQRFAGWAFVLAGIAYIVVWALAPVDTALTVGMCVVGAATLLVLVPCLWLALKRRSAGRVHS